MIKLKNSDNIYFHYKCGMFFCKKDDKTGMYVLVAIPPVSKLVDFSISYINTIPTMITTTLPQYRYDIPIDIFEKYLCVFELDKGRVITNSQKNYEILFEMIQEHGISPSEIKNGYESCFNVNDERLKGYDEE